MKSTSRRILSIALSLLMVIGVFSFGGKELLSIKADAYDISFEDTAYWPVPASRKINQRFSSSHKGLDIGGSIGNPVIASKGGKVVAAQPTWCNHTSQGASHNCVGSDLGTYGNYVEIKNYDGTTSRYAHMQYNTICVSVGQQVSAGQQIGCLGSSGSSTGPHLHFEIYNGSYTNRGDQVINPSSATVSRLGLTGDIVNSAREYYLFSGSTTPSQPTQLFTTSGITLPSGTLNKGSNFSVSGTINCTSLITWVNMSIINATTNTEIYKTPSATPQAYSYNISNLNSNLNFGSLGVGSYKVVLRAGTWQDGDMQNIVSAFNVVDNNAQLFTTSGIVLPTGYLVTGNDFNVSGTISCTSLITWVNLTIVNRDTGVEVFKTPSATPQAYSYNIANLNSSINFGTLSDGNYRAILKAGTWKDGDMKNITSDFQVTYVNDSIFTKTGIVLPSGTLNKGNDFNVAGTLSCSSLITWVNMSIYDATTNTEIFKTPSATPQANSYNIANLNGDINFGTLAVGSYRVVLRAGTWQDGDMKNVTSDFRVVNPDTTKPTITNVEISNKSADGFTVSCNVSDNVGVSSVKFPTWTAANGQDDLIWHVGTIVGNVAYFNVSFSDHNNEKGQYVTHIYAYDAAGNSTSVSTGVNVEENAPTIDNVNVVNVSPSGYQISCFVDDDTEIDYVAFPTWTQNNGQDDLIWKWGNIYRPISEPEGTSGTAVINISVSDHNNETGFYNTHIYVYDVWGNYTVYRCNDIRVPAESELYTITYNANGGTGAPESNSDYISVELSDVEPTRTNFTFLGWATSASATSAQYQPGDTITPGKSITLYAVWSQNTFTLTYNVNGGTGGPTTQSGKGNITLSSSKPSRTGYTFLGWATSASATSAQYQSGTTFNLTKDTTLYAVWKQDPVTPTTFTLTYDANNGSGAPAQQSGNGSITLSSTKPTRTGYKFLGWATRSTATSAQYQPGVAFNLTANTTLYAVWQKDETPDNPPVVTNPTVGIKNYKASRSEAYKTTITFTATAKDAPAGSTVHWIINGKDVGTGETYTVEKATSSFNVQTRLVSSNNKILTESEIESVEINTGFFAKLIAFFKGLFGLLPVIEQ